MQGRSATAHKSSAYWTSDTPNARAAAKRRAGAKSIGSLVPRLTRKAFENFGFPAAALLMDWDGIVGPELAAFTQPQKVKWPRQKDIDLTEFDENDQPPQISSFRDLSGATLVVKVDGARALELQHKAPQLIERINQYFGYRAVVELRIVQAPITISADTPWSSPFANKQTSKPRETLPEEMKSKYGIDRVENAGLQATLEAMAKGMENRKLAGVRRI